MKNRNLPALFAGVVGTAVHRQHDHLGADVDAGIEIGDVFVGEADAGRGDVGADAHRGVGDMMNGNSCSGAALAEPVKASVPIASAPRAMAARRELFLKPSRLNMCRPLSSACPSAR